MAAREHGAHVDLSDALRSVGLDQSIRLLCGPLLLQAITHSQYHRGGMHRACANPALHRPFRLQRKRSMRPASVNFKTLGRGSRNQGLAIRPNNLEFTHESFPI
jgi:hypothetical protein